MFIDVEDHHEPSESLLPPDERLPPRLSTIPEALKYQWNSSERRKFLLYKILLVTIFFAILIASAITPIFPSIRPTDCLIDYFQNWTGPINQYFQAHEIPKDILIALCSFLIDVLVLTMSLRWIYYDQNFRPLSVIIVFYGFRTLIQKIFYLQYPEGYIFGYPGFLSILVPYGPANDFFFSGHMGITTICFLQFYHDKVKFLYVLALITMPIEFFMLLTTRKHHFIDLPVGMMIAHYVFRQSFWFEGVVRKVINHFKRNKGKHV